MTLLILPPFPFSAKPIIGIRLLTDRAQGPRNQQSRSAQRLLVASHLARLDHQVKGVVNGSFTAKGLADIGVEGNDICTGVAAQGGKAEKSKSKAGSAECVRFTLCGS